MCFIPEGVIIEDGVWVGPRVTFTNDKYPPSPKKKWKRTFVRKGAHIGASCTILCGLSLGSDSMVGAGSVVTKSVKSGTTVCGVPAKVIRRR